MSLLDSAPSRFALATAHRARVVGEMVVHGAPVDFRELCVRAVPTSTRTLLLDLDRTVHLGRNMGELLGWEICAHKGYGAERHAALEASRGPGRFAIDGAHPGALLRYLAVGARMWVMPGLYYFFWGKLASRGLLRRMSFRALGPEPVRAAQRVPQTALMHHMAEVPLGTLRDLAARVWRRHASEQVILREDVAWLRRRCPSLRIVLTSASPQPMLEIAADALGVDDVVYSAIEERDGWLSAPAWRSRMFLPARAPRRISPPAALRLNVGRAKIDEIERRFPGALDADAGAVGITDTGYGEDHAWAQHLARVVDVNSTAPFPPIVGAASPLRAIHSASVLTRAERVARDAGRAWLDPRRKHAPARGPVRLEGGVLELALAGALAEVEALLVRQDEAARACAAEVEQAEATLREVEARVARAVDGYNEAAGEARPEALARLDALVADEAHARRALARAARPIGEVAHALAATLDRARGEVDALVEAEALAEPAPAASVPHRA